MEENQINNEELKLEIGNHAIKLLLSQKLITEENIKDIKISYGYIFTLKDGNIEALFKATHNENTYYFAFQKLQLKLLNINESLYKTLVLNMKDLHECLKYKNCNGENKK